MDYDQHDLEQLEQRQRAARAARDAEDPQRLGDAVTQSIIRATDALEKAANPHERKRRLANTIRARVNDPKMAHVEAERAAEYVVYEQLPLGVMFKLLDELDAAERNGQLRSSRGRWFVGVLKLRLRDFNIKQKKSRRIQ